jgi:hypothetical protein
MRRPPVLLALVALLLLAIPPVVLQAAITVTEVYVGSVTTNTSGAYTTDSGGTNPLTSAAGSSPFSIASGSLLMCGVAFTGTAPVLVTVTHDSTSLTSVGLPGQFEADYYAPVYYASGPLASSHVSIDVTTGTATGMGIACYEIAGVSVGSPIIQTKSSSGVNDATAHTITLDGARTANSALMYWGAWNGAVGTLTPEYGAEGTAVSYATPDVRGKMQWDIGGADTTPLWTTGNVLDSGLSAIEIAVASATTGKAQMLMLGVGEQ